ncbi:ABC1 kinase family protein [Chamaesiphon minutus]|uniref:Putative unusual protein kinase n=1 Tax=Chamaesiphon minutus (strain ATCC 27169 / PCC 6605) TaxID=1173020 RepID=K9UJ42_CHAP6|nr:AarF/ABC1/UbiB kinase family protein [Chamaesiphon minutus]AFY94683.1 putative unusual protein kinase [Chamaesiphon minutus PCC 6605]
MSQQQLTQLRRYNAQAIAKYYNRRPWLVIWRALVIVWLFAGFLIGLLLDRSVGNTEANKNQRAEQLREILTQLGPTFIKVGQSLSTRPDLIRQDFLDELIKLQDQLPPFDNELAMQIIESQLKRSVEELYKEISPRPIAAASLGQVYKARLYTGEQVAVKVQRPNLMPTITRDLYLLRWAASWIKPFLPLNLGDNLTIVVDEFGTKLFEEIDYQNEGRNAEKFAANFQDDLTVKVPAIYWRYTSHTVLTLEWIDGIKLTDIDGIKKAGLDRDTLIRACVASGLRQLLEFGFFHADPHPGNLFALADGRMAFIDFGMMDQLTQNTKETIAGSVVHLINKDYLALTDDFVRLGFLTPDVDISPIIPALERVLGNAIGENVGNFNFKTVTDEFSELMFQYPFRIPAQFSLIIRSLVTQEGVALSLNPNFKIVEIGYPYVAQRLLNGETPEMRRRLLEVVIKDGKLQWQRLENMIGIARTGGNFDLLPTAQLGLKFLMSEEGRSLRNQIVMALTEDNRLHITEVRQLWNLVKGELEPAKLLNVAIGALAVNVPKTLGDLSTAGVSSLLRELSNNGK